MATIIYHPKEHLNQTISRAFFGPVRRTQRGSIKICRFPGTDPALRRRYCPLYLS
ncbi:hypothetical protein EJ08DRAFT_649694 [Tothia fuscella]|uniref:Uncharacterized protein n=1 Tax=Tothia fuscella TaxID=1048955 RepID=A0A9P4TZ00_9PEZI|nr:hypothetical protein EJ08DRAFT_649694 [Tothia fuscella]